MNKNGKIFTCPICHKEFYRSASRIRLGDNKFCSLRCRNIDYKNRSPWNKGKKTGIIPKSAFKKGHEVTEEWKKAYEDGKIKPPGGWNKNLPPEKQPGYKNGRQKSGNGYVYRVVPNHPFADKRKRVLEHRYVMEQHLGRYLRKNEIIDHINEITDDNRIENLQIVTHGENLRLAYQRRKKKL